MGSKVPPRKVWKQTTNLITLEPVDVAIREIVQQTSWTEEAIRQKLFEYKLLICLQNARYHIYRDSLG
jgi:hypothetical protein